MTFANELFQSGCGWPAFFDGIYCLHTFALILISIQHIALPGAVSRHEDRTLGMARTEITCTACGGHLGHIFKGEGFNTPSMYTTFAIL